MIIFNRIIIALSLLSILIPTACNLPNGEDKAAASQTAMLETVIAGITQTVSAMPTHTNTPTMQPSNTAAALPTAGGISTVVPLPPTVPVSACNKATFVADVTIPDGSAIAPGVSFKKTWRLQNVGTCTWNANYAIVFVAGERMAAPDSAPLTSGSVPPGGTLDVSLTLTAPIKAGSYNTYFRLRAADGSIFGIMQDASGSFYVQIKVEGVTAIPTATGPTPTITYTPTTGYILTAAPYLTQTAAVQQTAAALAAQQTATALAAELDGS